MTKNQLSDVLVIGSGMGGMTAACLLAKQGRHVRVLEAAHVPGGCSSSYKRKGYVFESGATTLIGFDEHQPLRYLEQALGIHLTKEEISPSMTVHFPGERIVRYKNREEWIAEAVRVFGNPKGQKKFWDTCFYISDTVWNVSLKNSFFPPQTVRDWIRLPFANNPLHAPVLRYGFLSMLRLMQKCGVDTPLFKAFVDEQLMITAQAPAEETPALFGAAGLTYTNYSNYYVRGGLLEMIRELEHYLVEKGSEILCRKRVVSVSKHNNRYQLKTERGDVFEAPVVISNIPVWNMQEITEQNMQTYFKKEASRYSDAWGAFTMGVVTTDEYPDDMTLHHQIHLETPMPNTGASSLFVSMSARGDTQRAPEGERTLNISCHTDTAPWFSFNETYETKKMETQMWILEALRNQLPGFSRSELKLAFSATPITWQNWVYRKNGRVGGIPQSMKRSLLDWTPNKTPFKGFYVSGDTVYPGQGIPGVTLGGINVYCRIENDHILKQ